MAQPRKILHPEDLRFHGAGWHPSFARGVANRVRKTILDVAKTLELNQEAFVSDHSGGPQYNFVPRLLENWDAIHEEHMRPQKTYKRDQHELTAVTVNVPYVLRRDVHDIRRELGVGSEVSDEQIHRACDVAGELRELEENLVSILLRAYAAVRDFNRVPDSAGVRRNLEDLQRVPDEELLAAVNAVDGNTRAHIVSAWQQAESEDLSEPGDLQAWRQAIVRAHRRLPASRPGRPSGSIDLANRILGHELGEIFYRKAGRAPRRNWDGHKEKDTGRFLEFVDAVLKVVPEGVLQGMHRRGTTRHQIVSEIARQGSEIWKGHSLEHPPPDVFSNFSP